MYILLFSIVLNIFCFFLKLTGSISLKVIGEIRLCVFVYSVYSGANQKYNF